MLDDTGSVFGSARMNFETYDSKIAKGLMKTMNAEFTKKVQVAEEEQEKDRSLIPSTPTKSTM